MRMNSTATLLTLLAVVCFGPACRHLARPRAASAPGVMAAPAAANPAAAAAPLIPSPRLIVGRILAVDAAQGFAFVELGADVPAAALAEGTELIARTLELKETGRLQASRTVRGRTLGTKIVGGQPSPGDEVAWLAP